MDSSTREIAELKCFCGHMIKEHAMAKPWGCLECRCVAYEQMAGKPANFVAWDPLPPGTFTTSIPSTGSVVGAESGKPVEFLNPDNELEAALIDIVRMHREKSGAYATEEDTFQNFLDIANQTGTHPMEAADTLLAKHQAYITKCARNWTYPDNKYTHDAYLDRAVYGIIAYCLYLRYIAENFGDEDGV